MEAFLERDVNAIARIQLTPIERDAFLLSQLADALLRRLPIHLRSDGTTGNAENVFREADWPIPEALEPHVLTIRLRDDRQTRERQERLIVAWSPRSQIEVALAQTEPHRFHSEILGALAKLNLHRTSVCVKHFEPSPGFLRTSSLSDRRMCLHFRNQ